MLPGYGDTHPSDTPNFSSQSFWSAFVPGLLVLAFGVTEILLSPGQSQYNGHGHIHFFRHWRLLLLGLIALLEFCAWITLGIYYLATNENDSRAAIFSVVIGITWFYSLLKPVICPRCTAYVDLFVLYTAHLSFGVIRVGASIYHHHLGTASPMTLAWIGMPLDVVAVATGLGIISTMPLKTPPDELLQDTDNVCSPEDYASIFEWATYSWVYPLIKIGNTREMKPGDVWDLTPAMQSRSVFTKFTATEGPTLFRRLLKANCSDLLLDIVLTIATVLLSYGAPFFLYQILYLIENPTQEGRSKACVLALIAFVCAILKGEADAQHLFFGRRASARVYAQLINAIYDKALKQTGITMQGPVSETGPATSLPNVDPPKPGTGGGRTVSLIAVDAHIVSAIVASSYLLYGGLVEMTLACTMLYNLLGSAAYAGVGLMLGTWVFHVCVAQLRAHSQRELSISRDQRMSILYELINAVRFIKFFSLEDRWVGRVQDARCVELDQLKQFKMRSILSAIVSTAAPMLVSVISFLVYINRGHQLTPSVAFTTIALMGMLRQPLNVFPNFLMQVLESRLSLERIEAFLFEEDSSDSRCSVEIGDGFSINRGRFRWKKVPNETIGVSPQPNDPEENVSLDRNHFELQDISVHFPNGKLSVITGPTGCGKTALLLALLGQMTMVEGKLVKPGDTSNASRPNPAAISYAAQIPWLHSGTVKENILFGYQYDEQKYEDVVEHCALRPDLNQLSEGDQTQVGDRGANLSSGQKARIALARAVYAETRYVLLDDPFSAVDTRTLRYLYERLFCGPLLKGRTVIIVTHYIELLLPKADYVVRMQDGKITTQDSTKNLRRQRRLPSNVPPAQDVQIHRRISVQPTREHEPDEIEGAASSTYKTYLRMLPGRTWIAFAFLLSMTQVMGVFEKLWIREWGQAYGSKRADPLVWYDLGKNAFPDPVSNTYQRIQAFLPNANDCPVYYVAVYAVIACITALLSISSTKMLYDTVLKASSSLFSELLNHVVYASLPWHDTTPRGQILDRFSKDVQAIDVNLSNDVATVGNAFVNFVTALITVVVFFPLFVIPAIVIVICYCFVGTRYSTANQKLLRMESTSRSHIFSAFEELLNGIVTIQAFEPARRSMEEFHRKVDVANKMYYNSWMTNRWLLFNYDVLGACAVLSTTLLALSEDVDAGTAGLCMTSAMVFTMSMYFVCRYGASLGLELNAVRRVADCRSIPKDHPGTTQSSRLPDPPRTLSMENLRVRYTPRSEPVLRDVSFTLEAPACIAIVGQTGSGKSTLVNSILRFVELTDGRVLIDKSDISKMDTHELRSHITYIPEDAILFSGTLRENVDPLHMRGDEDCLDALRKVKFLRHGQHSWSSSDGLDIRVAPAGANFSPGERQLIAMARALLRRDSIVILDEATSSIDFDTDAEIQKILRKVFEDALLINVAHRLSTVFDYDRVVVLKDGQVVEIDTPRNLIERDGGIFKEMCLSGNESYAEIEAAIFGKINKDR